MTIISPHGTAFVPRVPAQGRTARAESSASFAGLLEDMASGPRPQNVRPFTFAELGMFGQHGALVPRAAEPDRVEALYPARPLERGVGKDHRLEQVLAIKARLVQGSDAKAAIKTTAGHHAQRRLDGSYDLAHPQEEIEPSSSGEVQDAAANVEAEPPEPPVAHGRAALPAHRIDTRLAPNPVSLVVSGPEDALRIVARSQHETPELRARLRRLIEDTARETGMDITEFHLNGSPTEPSFLSAMGGTHGARAR